MFGLELALNHGFQSVIVESDCKRIVNVVLHKSSHGSYQKYILQDILGLSCRFCSFSLIHISRNANMVAHHLSRFSLENENSAWVGFTPFCIQSFVLKDMSLID